MAAVLQLTPHAVFPPTGGRRAFFFLREMARAHEVTGVLPQTKESILGPSMGYFFPQNVRLFSPLETPPPKTVFDWLPRRLAVAVRGRWLQRCLRGPASAVVLDNSHLLKQALRQHRIDVVVIDHVQSLPSVSLIRRLSPKSAVVFHAHNVDSDLALQLLRGASSDAQRKQFKREYQACRRWESRLSRCADTFWACSETDRRKLEELNGGAIEGHAIPNGVDTKMLCMDRSSGKRGRRKLIFCGHMRFQPNVNGLKWFSERIWPLIRHRDASVSLIVIGFGGIPSALSDLQHDARVEFRGEVESVIPHYHEATIAIVPLLQGSGVREKILEAMSLGNPVVSTTKGAEGIEYEAGRHLFLADEPRAFADDVCRLLEEENLFEEMRRTARQFVEERYDWEALGHKINNLVDSLADGARD